jgi:hypothetical protein
VRILGSKQEIPEHINRQVKKAGLGRSDFYVGPVVDKKVNRSEASIPSHPDQDLEARMRKREEAAMASRVDARRNVSFMQRLRHSFRRLRLSSGVTKAP